MGRSDSKKESLEKKSLSSSVVSSDDSDEDDEDDEDDDMDAEDREETPDLYRNSSLGMYAIYFEYCLLLKKKSYTFNLIGILV